MAMAYFFKRIFATAGLRAKTPTTSTTGLDLERGYSNLYQQPGGEANVERSYFNGILYEITEVLNEFQTLGAIRWTPASENDNIPVVYNKSDLVHYRPQLSLNGLYVSRINNNTTSPENTANWARIDNISGLAIAFRPLNNLTTSVPKFGRVDLATPDGICGIVKHGSNSNGRWRQFSDNTIFFEVTGTHAVTDGGNPQTFTLPITINTTTHDIFWESVGFNRTMSVPLDTAIYARIESYTTTTVTITFDYWLVSDNGSGGLTRIFSPVDFATNIILPCWLISKTPTNIVQVITVPS